MDTSPDVGAPTTAEPVAAAAAEIPATKTRRKRGGVPGLHINAAGQYVHSYLDNDGKRHRDRVGTIDDPEAALLKYNANRRELRIGYGMIASTTITFEEFSKVWWEKISPGPKRWRSVLDAHLIPTFGATRLKHLTGERVVRYIAGRRKVAAANTVISERTVLQHMFRRAVRWRYLEHNPIADGTGKTIDDLRIKTPPPVTRTLSALEETRVLKRCEKYPLLRELVIVALHTGGRRNELLGIKRSDIDWERATLAIHATKTGSTRTVPLNVEAMRVLRGLPVRIDGKLFPQKPKQGTDAFKTACLKAGLRDVHFHCLRHTFGTRLAGAGVALPAISALMGHTTTRMTERYVHLADAYHRGAVEKLVAVGPEAAETANEAANA